MLDVELINNLYKKIWWNTSNILNLDIKTSSIIEKKKQEKKFEKIMDFIINHIEKYPAYDDERSNWKKDFNLYLDKIIDTEDFLHSDVFDEKMKHQFIKTAKKFYEQCKNFDSGINQSDIGQAMRNVWIINLIQMITGQEIKLNDAIFGYSMLYPYSDNYLDNKDITIDDKNIFNMNFVKRLKGHDVIAQNKLEKIVFELVRYIENVFDRQEYPDVYQSLLLIQYAQEKSLIVQDSITTPYEKDILGITIEKGGTSVLVDSCLVNGKITEGEEIFAHGYGFILQLCDDLQDVKADINDNHMTMISQIAGKYNLDNITNKLFNLTEDVITNATCFKQDKQDKIRKTLKYCCTMLILFSIAYNNEYYSKDYVKNIERYLPFTLKYIQNIKGKFKPKLNKLKKSYHGVLLEEIIMFMLD